MKCGNRGALAQHTIQKQLVSPKDCLQGPAMLTIAFLQVHLLVGRKGAACCPRGGWVMEGWVGDDGGG